MTNDERRQRQMEFIVEALGQLTIKHQQAEKRTERLERIVKMMIRAGRRERREWRERYNALLDSQIRTEEIVRRNNEAAEHRAAQMDEVIKRANEVAERASEAAGRASESVAQLAEIIRQQTLRSNGDGRSDT